MGMSYEPEPHCFVCGRHTDHFGEHDDLVDAGRAVYDAESGTVYAIDRGQGWSRRMLRERGLAAAAS